MNVRQLIEALKQCPPNADVRGWNSEDNNEFHIGVVTVTKRHPAILLLANCADEVGPSEIILHVDLTENDEQFGVGA